MRADLPQKLPPPPADDNSVGHDFHSIDGRTDGRRLINDQTSLDDPLQQNAIKSRPKQRLKGRKFGKFKQNIHFPLTKLIVDKAQVFLVKAQGFSINLSAISPAMAVRTQGN